MRDYKFRRHFAGIIKEYEIYVSVAAAVMVAVYLASRARPSPCDAAMRSYDLYLSRGTRIRFDRRDRIAGDDGGVT